MNSAAMKGVVQKSDCAQRAGGASDLVGSSNHLLEYFNSLAPVRDRWIEKNWFYHRELARTLCFFVPAGSSVVEIGSSTGVLLNDLQPTRGLGLDFSPAMVEIAQRKYPHLEFRVDNLEQLQTTEKFDYVVLSDVVGFVRDVQSCLNNLHRLCHSSTRIVITQYHALWEPLLRLAEKLNRKAKEPLVNWLTAEDLVNLVDLAEFEPIRSTSRVLLPVYVPLLSTFCNRFLANLPVFRGLALLHVVVARPRALPIERQLSCTVVVPCRNERGNIRPAVDRIPDLGSHTEIVFVEGHSSDGTAEEIQNVMAERPERDIKMIVQPGIGKGDAVRAGFEIATGELLMVLDADLTVDPEELPKFYNAIAAGKADFVHGSRLIYPVENEAMRFLNRIGNHFFGIAFTFLLGQKFKDTLCGTKVLSRSDYGRIAANRNYFGNFDPFGDFDLIFGAAKLNLKIVEVPIHYRARTYGTTNISRFRHGWLLLRMAWYAMWRLKFV